MKRDLWLIVIGAFIGLVAAAATALHAHPSVFTATFASTRARASHCGCGPLADVRDLPLVVDPAPYAGHTMAVLISGDGGWRGIDRSIAAGLNARGVSVVGLVAPAYFGKRKTPEQASCDLRRIIEFYSIYWHAPKVIISGYSRGAGVAPFMVSRLPAKWQAHVESIAFIALERTIDFQVTPLDLFRTAPASRDIPVAGEIAKLRGKRLICIYGVRDPDNLCRDLSPSLVTPVPEPGGHHFAGNYEELAGTILKLSHS